jgi:hypothetical protein
LLYSAELTRRALKTGRVALGDLSASAEAAQLVPPGGERVVTAWAVPRVVLRLWVPETRLTAVDLLLRRRGEPGIIRPVALRLIYIAAGG